MQAAADAALTVVSLRVRASPSVVSGQVSRSLRCAAGCARRGAARAVAGAVKLSTLESRAASRHAHTGVGVGSRAGRPRRLGFHRECCSSCDWANGAGKPASTHLSCMLSRQGELSAAQWRGTRVANSIRRHLAAAKCRRNGCKAGISICVHLACARDPLARQSVVSRALTSCSICFGVTVRLFCQQRLESSLVLFLRLVILQRLGADAVATACDAVVLAKARLVGVEGSFLLDDIC
jgi:hypothetical protein